jgi:hypothetical protein
VQQPVPIGKILDKSMGIQNIDNAGQHEAGQRYAGDGLLVKFYHPGIRTR